MWVPWPRIRRSIYQSAAHPVGAPLVGALAANPPQYLPKRRIPVGAPLVGALVTNAPQYLPKRHTPRRGTPCGCPGHERAPVLTKPPHTSWAQLRKRNAHTPPLDLHRSGSRQRPPASARTIRHLTRQPCSYPASSLPARSAVMVQLTTPGPRLTVLPVAPNQFMTIYYNGRLCEGPYEDSHGLSTSTSRRLGSSSSIPRGMFSNSHWPIGKRLCNWGGLWGCSRAYHISAGTTTNALSASIY